MLLAHRIRIDATAAQRDYFARAAGTARRVWNWALAEWNRQAACGLRPNAMALKKAFNHIKYSDPDWLDADGKPWLRAIHRDAHAQPFANLAKAWSRYFEQRRTGQPAHAPRFKTKGRSAESFYVANGASCKTHEELFHRKRDGTCCITSSSLSVGLDWQRSGAEAPRQSTL